MSVSEFSRKTPWGEVRGVLLRRTIGGRDIVSTPPNEDRLSAVQATNPEKSGNDSERYTEFMLIMIPESKESDVIPGCSLIVLPLGRDGRICNGSNSMRFEDPSMEDIFTHLFNQDMLRLSTDFEDLQALHTALGQVIASIKEAASQGGIH